MTTRALALAGALAISLGAAACSKADGPSTGSSSTPSASTTSAKAQAPTASEVLEKARTNALSATSGAFAGEIDQDGKTMKIDFKGTSDGKTADIALELETEGKVHLISVKEGLFMQADAAFWKAQGAPTAVQNAGEKFIKAPTAAGSMTSSLSLKSFLEKAFGAITPTKLATKVDEENVNGIDCWVLSDSAGKAEGSLYVSKDRFEVVRFTGSKKSPGQLDFSKWNEDLGITAPPAAQIMPLG